MGEGEGVKTEQTSLLPIPSGTVRITSPLLFAFPRSALMQMLYARKLSKAI